MATSLAVIVTAALLLRIGFAFQYSSHYSQRGLSVLPFLFESGNIAVSIATGHGFSSPLRVPTGPTAWMTPVYPYLLAGVLRIFGVYTLGSFVVAVGLNILFVTAATVPIFYAAKRIGGRGIAAGAAWLWAVFPNAILIPVESLWEASLSALLVAMILWASLRLADVPSLRNWCYYGLLWGFTLMTNPSIAAVLPFLLVWLAWRTRKSSGMSGAPSLPSFGKGGIPLLSPVAGIGLSLAIAALCCVPWTIRNYRVFHTLVPLRSVAGLPLWLGNSDVARPGWSVQHHPINDSLERARYIQAGEIAYMREKRELALEYMRTHPARVAELTARRFVALWSGGTPFPLHDLVNYDSLQFRYVLLFNLAIAVGTLAGIVVMVRRRDPHSLLLAVFPVVYPLTYYITMVVPRYRLPIDPVLMILTAVAIAKIAGRPANPQSEFAHARA